MNTALLEKAVQGDTDAKEQLIQENAGLIWSIVRRYYGRGVESEDLYQLGCLGFLKAIEGFDMAYGTQFSTYAVPKISGEIRRFLRDDGAIKVSRSLKEQAVKIRHVKNDLILRLGREPFVSEIAEETGLTPEEIAAAELASMPMDSLERPTGENGCELGQLLTGEEMEERVLESIALRNAICKLEPRPKAVIQMRYFRGLTQEKTASILGISQVQVSRIERKAIEMLRGEMTEY